MKKNQKRSAIGFLTFFIILVSTNLCQATAINKEQYLKANNANSKGNIASRSVEVNVSEISGGEYYIKNACTGQYLDVSGGVAADGTNVQQYKYNGTDSQKWYIKYNENDGDFSILTRLGNDGYQYIYSLDISGGSDSNYANANIWYYNNTPAQKFFIEYTEDFTFIIKTKVSNYSKAIVLDGPSFEQGANINQYTYQQHINEQWILEPVNESVNLGAKYAYSNYNRYLYTFPDCRSLGGDCTDFVSQCLIAGGTRHYDNDWKVYRKNTNYSQPTNAKQLDDTWELCQPNTSPWISAAQFKQYWLGKNTTMYYCKGQEVLDHPDVIYNLDIEQGDVIQLANTKIGGALGDAHHSMYVTGYINDGTNNTYLLTYHSNPTLNKSLLEICKNYRSEYILFYKF